MIGSPNWAVGFAVLSISFMASGCGGPGPVVQNVATISYEQVGACSGYKNTSNSIVSAGPQAAFVVFRVGAIDNSGSKIAFNFDPEKMFVPPNSSVSTSLSLYRDLGVLTASSRTVPAGTKTVINGFVVAVVPTDVAEANNTNYMLSYKTGANEPGVLYIKTNREQTQWPNTPDCTTVKFAL